MGIVRDIATEALKALAVLALVFLSFAHQPIAIAQPDSDGWAVADLSYCGAPGDEDGTGHSPCHACRTGVVDLPPVPCEIEPAYAGFAELAFPIAETTGKAQTRFAASHARAPPALA